MFVIILLLIEKYYWKNIIDENEKWLDETGGDRSKLKMFHNSSHEIQIQPTHFLQFECKQTIFVLKDKNIFIELIMVG